MKKLALVLLIALFATTANAAQFNFKTATRPEIMRHVFIEVGEYVYDQRNDGAASSFLIEDAGQIAGLTWDFLDETPYSDIIERFETSGKFTSLERRYLSAVTGYVYMAKAAQSETGKTKADIKNIIVGLVRAVLASYNDGDTFEEYCRDIDNLYLKMRDEERAIAKRSSI
jgi:hypothetical protein